MNTKPDIYLEISGRGTGKTYRLIHAVADWIRSDSNRIAVIHVATQRGFLAIFDSIILEEWMRKKILRSTDHRLRGSKLELKHFYDEFEHNPDFKLENDPSGYYVTSVSRIRTIEELCDTATKDPLLKLIRANGGKYVTYNGILAIPFSMDKIVLETRDNIPENTFQAEYLSILVK